MAPQKTRSASQSSQSYQGLTPDDATERLIAKVCTNVVKQLEIKLGQRFDSIDQKLSEVTVSLKSMDAKIVSNTEAIKSLNARSDSFEQLVKKNSLRFIGVEEEQGENIVDLIVKLTNENLRVPCNIRDIDSAFRVGNNVMNDRPRPILVSFVQNIKRTEVYNAKKLLKNYNMAIFEDLTKNTYDLLSKAKRKYGKNKVWSAGGKVIRWDSRDNKKIIINPDDLLH